MIYLEHEEVIEWLLKKCLLVYECGKMILNVKLIWQPNTQQQVRAQDEGNSSCKLEKMFQSSQFLQPVKIPWLQVVPYACQ